MSKQRRKMPSIRAIFCYWSSRGYQGSAHQCMECGVGCRPQRAHIVARWESQDDSVNNLVLVCPRCHVMTDGRSLENWEKRLIGDGLGSITIVGMHIPFEFWECLTRSKDYHAREVMRCLFDGGEE